MNKNFTFGDRIVFLFEKHIKSYNRYSEESIVKEKTIIAQKIFQNGLLCWSTGRIGV
jgi:hypothetical protein